MPKFILKERTQYYLEYKSSNNKKVLEKLILTFIPVVENIIKKYVSQGLEHDEMLSIGVEEVINAINEFEIDADVAKIGVYINQRINARLQSELNKAKFISYEEYFKNKKNGEEGYFDDSLIENVIDLVGLQEVFSILNEHQKRIIILRYGLFNNSQLTNEAIGKVLGISRQAVHMQEQEVMKK